MDSDTPSTPCTSDVLSRKRAYPSVRRRSTCMRVLDCREQIGAADEHHATQQRRDSFDRLASIHHRSL